MSITSKILYKSFVKPFYRQNAGLFAFIFILFFGVVGVVDGSGLLSFHFSLIKGMLGHYSFLLVVFFAWFLYAKKTEQFFSNNINHPEYSFIRILSQVEPKTIFGWMARLQFLLLLPIILYSAIVFATGIYLKKWAGCIAIVAFLLLLILAAAGWYTHQVLHPEKFKIKSPAKLPLKIPEIPYWTLLLRYVLKEKKILFLGIKLYSCLILYEMVIHQTLVEYDLSMIYIFFSIGILSHGLLIHHIRNLEESRLAFYRTVPRSILNRYMQYACIYFILLIPEFITILALHPHYLALKDSLLFILFSFTLVMFLNSLLFIQFFRIKDYLKIIVCIFLLIYLCVLSSTIPVLIVFFLLSSIGIFQNRYYLFERSIIP